MAIPVQNSRCRLCVSNPRATKGFLSRKVIKKYKTNIKNKVFVGSNTSLIAPVTLEENSVIGAGSVITKRVKAKSLALTRANQQETKNYKRKKK